MVVNRDVKRPVCQYYGGKWVLAPWVLSCMPPHRIYVELYGGGGSVLLRKPRSEVEVYNDLDSEIVNVFRVLRDRPDELLRAVDLTPYSREEYELALQYSDDPVERARRYIVRATQGHSGHSSQYDFSGNASGFSTGEVRMKGSLARSWASFADALVDIVDRMKGVTIEHKEALSLLSVWDSPGTVFYADPPYLSSVRRSKSVYRHEMTERQHIELADALCRVSGSVLVSGYDSPLYNDLYGGWERRERLHRSQGVSRKNPFVDIDRVEVLWVKKSVWLPGVGPG